MLVASVSLTLPLGAKGLRVTQGQVVAILIYFDALMITETIRWLFGVKID